MNHLAFYNPNGCGKIFVHHSQVIRFMSLNPHVMIATARRDREIEEGRMKRVHDEASAEYLRKVYTDYTSENLAYAGI